MAQARRGTTSAGVSAFTALVAVLLAPATALAWTFTPLPVCTLAHDEPGVSVRITFDPSRPQAYAIAVTRRGGNWTTEPRFSILFDGAYPLTISTDRLTIGDDLTSITVSDTGFGNVLDGLEFNTRATARQGDVSVPFDLTGAAPEVRRFRACRPAPGV